MFVLLSFSIAELLSGSLFTLPLTVVLKYQSQVPAVLQPSPGGTTCLCRPGHPVRTADWLSIQPLPSTLLCKKRKRRQVLLLVQRGLSSCSEDGRHYIWEQGMSECLPERSLCCPPASTRLLPRLQLPVLPSLPHYSCHSNVLFSIYFTNKAGELIGRPATFLLC